MMAGRDWIAPAEWLVLRGHDGTRWDVLLQEEPRVDAAVSTYVDSGGTRDTVLSLTLAEGGELRILASALSAWWACTPDHRRRLLVRQQADAEEDRAMRTELGMPWEEL